MLVPKLKKFEVFGKLSLFSHTISRFWLFRYIDNKSFYLPPHRTSAATFVFITFDLCIHAECHRKHHQNFWQFHFDFFRKKNYLQNSLFNKKPINLFSCENQYTSLSLRLDEWLLLSGRMFSIKSRIHLFNFCSDWQIWLICVRKQCAIKQLSI